MAGALRTTLIWHDEVMADVVRRRPAPITLGATGKSTFTVSDLGLPPDFAMFAPGSRGYILTLGARMRGAISIDGREQDVGELVKQGEFAATPLGSRDWGLVDLHESGSHKVFFQFVPDERKRVRVMPLLLAAMTAWLLCGAIVGGIAGLAVSMLALAVIGVGYWFLRCDNELQLSHVFSLVLHGALIAFCIVIYEPRRSWAMSDPSDLTADYYVTRLQTPPDEPVDRPTPSQIGQPAATPETAPIAAPPAPKAPIGGRREHAPLPPVGLVAPRNDDEIQKVIDRGLHGDIDKFLKLPGDPLGGPGRSHCRPPDPCSGTNTDGTKPPGPPSSGFKRSEKPIVESPKHGDCLGEGCDGGVRPKRSHIELDGPGGDPGTYDPRDIDRVVRKMSGLFKSCYQRELDHLPDLGGTLTVHFTIDGDSGSVTSASGSGLGNAEVEGCVVRNVYKLRFDPKPGTTAHITYPFVFSSGG